MVAQNSTLRIVIDSRTAVQNTEKLNKEIEKFERNGVSAGRSADALSGSMKSLALSMASVVTVGNAISKMDAYTNLQNKLKLVTESQNDLNAAMQTTLKVAQSASQDWTAVANTYAKFASNAKQLKLEQKDLGRITETTAKAIAISGSTAEASAGAMFQFGQALDGGILRAEEFNSLVDGAGGLLKAMEIGLGVTRKELRQMMLDGKLTGEVMSKALLKAYEPMNELYNKTDSTIKDGFVKLNNAITEYVGGAGQASGASKVLASSISTIADNLGLLSDGALVAGIAYATKAIATKTIAIRDSIVASNQAKASALAEAEANTRLLGVQAQRARQTVALAIQEVDLARKEYNGAASASARATAIQRLTSATIAQSIAEKQASVAMTAYTVATNSATTATTMLTRAKALASAVVGGPMGLALLVGTLATSYLLLRDNTEKSTASLRENNETVDDAIVKYRELSKVQQQAQKVAEQRKLADISKELKNEETSLISMTLALSRNNDATMEAQRSASQLALQFKQDKDLNKFMQGISKLSGVTEDAKNKLITQMGAVDKLGKEWREQKKFGDMLNATLEQQANKAKSASTAITELSEAVNKAIRESNKSISEMTIDATLATKGYDQALSDIIKRWFAVEGAIDKTTGKFNKAVQEQINLEYKRHLEATKAMDARNDKERERNKLLEDQAKLIKTSGLIDLIARGEGSYNSVNLGKRGGYKSSTRNLEQMTVGQVMEAQRRGEFNAVGRYQLIKDTLESGVVTLKIDKNQLFDKQTQDRLFTEYLVGSKRPQVMQYAQGKGSLNSALLALAQEFASVADYRTGKSFYNGVGNNKSSISAQEVTNALNGLKQAYAQNKSLGMTDLDAYQNALSKTLTIRQEELDVTKMTDEYLKDIQKRTEQGLALEYQSLTESSRIRAENAMLQKEISESIFDSAETQKAVADLATKEMNLRLQILEKEKDLEVNGHRKTEEEKLKINQEISEINLELSRKFNSQELADAKLKIREKYAFERTELTLQNQQKLFEAERFMMTESEAIKKQYELERKEIALTRDEQMRADLLSLSFLKQRKEIEDSIINARKSWLEIQTQMRGGVSQFETISDTAFSRVNVSGALADAQENDLQSREKGMSEADILAEREQIWRDHEARITEIKRQADYERTELSLSYASTIAESTAGMFKSMLGEQSTAYKAMFAVQKGFAIASATLNFTKALSDAFSDPSALTLPQKLANYATIASAGAQVISQIASIKEGFASGGYTGDGGKYDVAGLVHRGEVVFSQDDVRRSGGVQAVENLRLNGANKGITVNIENNGTYKDFEVQQLSENEIRIIARDETRKTVSEDLRQPNSNISKTLRQTKNIGERR